MKPRKKTLTWLIIVYILTILAFSVAMFNTKTALNRTSILQVRLDHLLHVLLFVPWMVLIRWRWKKYKSISYLILAFGAGLVLAAFSEGVQWFLSYRSFSLIDLAANGLGIVLGTLISRSELEDAKQ